MEERNMALTSNKYILNWIDDMAAMTKPDKIVWIDGSEEQAEALRAEACSTGEMVKLNEKLLPNCYLHRTAVNDVARVEDRTFICTKTKEGAGNINNWLEPQECYAKLTKLFTGSMTGRRLRTRCSGSWMSCGRAASPTRSCAAPRRTSPPLSAAWGTRRADWRTSIWIRRCWGWTTAPTSWRLWWRT